VDHQQENERAFRELHDRLIGPAQETFKLRLSVDRKAKRQEMRRQECRKRETLEPMNQGSDPKQIRTATEPRTSHDSTTAATARRPITSSKAPKQAAMIRAHRCDSDAHSTSTVRKPIDEWMEAAQTNRP
jgi:hypothetical protein